MIKSLLLTFLFALAAQASFSQENAPASKECRIMSGGGIGAATQNIKSVGQYIWLQLSYTLLQNVAVATEFENIGFTRPGYYEDLPIIPNEVKVVDNYFSLLLKYYLPIKSRLKIAGASGWSYVIRQEDYYIFEKDSAMQHTFRNVTAFSNYSIPVLLEIGYPVSKAIDIQGRVKYNVLAQNGGTYSAGIGLSLKL